MVNWLVNIWKFFQLGGNMEESSVENHVFIKAMDLQTNEVRILLLHPNDFLEDRIIESQNIKMVDILADEEIEETFLNSDLNYFVELIDLEQK